MVQVFAPTGHLALGSFQLPDNYFHPWRLWSFARQQHSPVRCITSRYSVPKTRHEQNNHQLVIMAYYRLATYLHALADLMHWLPIIKMPLKVAIFKNESHVCFGCFLCFVFFCFFFVLGGFFCLFVCFCFVFVFVFVFVFFWGVGWGGVAWTECVSCNISIPNQDIRKFWLNLSYL